MLKSDKILIMAQAYAEATNSPDAVLPRHIARLASPVYKLGQLSPEKMHIRIGKVQEARPYTFSSIAMPEKRRQIVSLSALPDHLFVLPYPDKPDQLKLVAAMANEYSKRAPSSRPYVGTAFKAAGRNVTAIASGEGYPMWELKLLSEIDVRAAVLSPVSDDIIRDGLNDETGPAFADPAPENV